MHAPRASTEPCGVLGAEAVRRSASALSVGLGSADSGAFCGGPETTGSRALGARRKAPDAATRKKLDVIAAGHASRGGSEIQVDRPGTILKMLDATERDVYRRLRDTYAEDPVYAYTPEYHGDVKGVDDSGKPIEFIRINNLLMGFLQPKVIDIKLGIRTFLESECDNPKPRNDLYKRMCELYPEDLTTEEREKQAITKYKWMSSRDAHTTISSLGFRVDGIAGYRKKPRELLDQTIAKMITHEDVIAVLAEFAHVAATDDGDCEHEDIVSVDIAEEMLQQLEELYHACVESAFVKAHEFIGSSLLLIADAYGNVGVSWIDFAKTHFVAEGEELTHRTPWNIGNHEDGVLTGLTNLLQAWREVVAMLRTALPKMRVQDSMDLNSGRVACFCTKWRERRARKRRREKAAQRQLRSSQSDVSLLSALPAFQGSNALVDVSSLRHLVQMGADAVGVASGELLQLAQHGAEAAVAVTSRGVEAAGTIAMAAGTGVADAADAVRRSLRKPTPTGLKEILRGGSSRKGTDASLSQGIDDCGDPAGQPDAPIVEEEHSRSDLGEEPADPAAVSSSPVGGRCSDLSSDVVAI
ncbi:unnamed protein product [Prorocentrum cordatum]|uniref:Kinase n=1 Tax=Prorocentrum cordatum TaxID=2364126 RepID=A0ABN9UE30_9DINO|nr:unnamed protein product [Polarella glacialis]